MDAHASPHTPRRRTPERILVAALDHFNRYGEPQVSTHLIAAALRISSGNLHYHFHTKDDLILALFERYDADLRAALSGESDIDSRPPLHAWLLGLFHVHWRHRFVLRDLSSLITRHLAVEQRLPPLLADQHQAIERTLRRLYPDGTDAGAIAAAVHLALVHWVTHAFLQAPRSALEDSNAHATEAALAQHLEGCLRPAAAGH